MFSMFDRCSVSEAWTCSMVSLFIDAYLTAHVSYIMWKCSEFGKDYKWCVRKWSKPDPQVDVTLISICRIIRCLFVCFYGRPRQATDVLQPAGLLYRPLWTFQLWPPDAPAPIDAFRTLAAEVGTYRRGIGPIILPKCRLPPVHLGFFYLKIRRLRSGLNPRT
jgi:hypothetical protein